LVYVGLLDLQRQRSLSKAGLVEPFWLPELIDELRQALETRRSAQERAKVGDLGSQPDDDRMQSVLAPTLLTVRQVAARLNVHPGTVRRWVRSGRLPAVKVGRVVRFDQEQVRKALEGRP
jgi:excisionase family DNA binding protein